MTRFGVHIGPQQCSMAELREAWRQAEALGYDWISTWDHLYPSTIPPVGGCFEGLTTHAALAALTSRPRVGSLVYSAAFRHPALLANAAVSIDHLSGGRLELGIGAGWQEAEHRAHGLPFAGPAARLRRLAETIEIVRLLWTEDRVDYDGEFSTLRDARCDPKPVQRPPRIWVGASGERAGLPLAGRLGDGWNVPFAAPAEFARKLDIVRGAAARPDRLETAVNVGIIGAEDEAEIDAELRRRFGDAAGQVRPATLAGSAERMADMVRAYVDAGADWIILALRAPFDMAALGRFATEVMPLFRAPAPSAAGPAAADVDLGSPEWFAELGRAFTAEVARHGIAADRLCYQEVFTGPSPVAWHVRLDGGRIVSLGYGDRIEGADVETVVDRDAARPLARLRRADPAYAAAAEGLARSGRASVTGDPARKAVFSGLFDRVHDRLAGRTR